MFTRILFNLRSSPKLRWLMLFPLLAGVHQNWEMKSCSRLPLI